MARNAVLPLARHLTTLAWNGDHKSYVTTPVDRLLTALATALVVSTWR